MDLEAAVASAYDTPGACAAAAAEVKARAAAEVKGRAAAVAREVVAVVAVVAQRGG